MIKVEIKPVYEKTANEQKDVSIPKFLEKRIKVFGITVYRKRVLPLKNSNGDVVEYMCRC